jgi:hypothetical protein
MTDRELSEGEIAKMETPIWEQAKAAIDAGESAQAKVLIVRGRSGEPPATTSINWITSMLTFVAEELREGAVARAAQDWRGVRPRGARPGPSGDPSGRSGRR